MYSFTALLSKFMFIRRVQFGRVPFFLNVDIFCFYCSRLFVKVCIKITFITDGKVEQERACPRPILSCFMMWDVFYVCIDLY